MPGRNRHVTSQDRIERAVAVCATGSSCVSIGQELGHGRPSPVGDAQSRLSLCVMKNASHATECVSCLMGNHVITLAMNRHGLTSHARFPSRPKWTGAISWIRLGWRVRAVACPSNSISDAARFSSRRWSDAVPGSTRCFGARSRAHASATWAGVRPRGPPAPLHSRIVEHRVRMASARSEGEEGYESYVTIRLRPPSQARPGNWSD